MYSKGKAVKDHDQRGHADVDVRIPSRQRKTLTFTALMRTRMLIPLIKKHTNENMWKISRKYVWNIEGIYKEYP